MMVRSPSRDEGMRVYDPCSGSGGMLIMSQEHLDEHGGERPQPSALRAGGQRRRLVHLEDEHAAARHPGCRRAERRHACVLRSTSRAANSCTSIGSDQSPFQPELPDRVGINFPERFRYGLCPTAARRPISCLCSTWSRCCARRHSAPSCPMASSFEGEPRRRFAPGFLTTTSSTLSSGLAPNLFYGTGIPACILVLRANGSKPAERQGKVLFINADARVPRPAGRRTTLTPSTSRRS